MFALDLLRIAFAGCVDFCGEVAFVGTPGICIVAPDTKGLEQGLQFHKDLVCAPTKDVRQHLPAAVIEGVPQPPWLLLLSPLLKNRDTVAYLLMKVQICNTTRSHDADAGGLMSTP